MIWSEEKDKLFLEALELYGMENAKAIKKHLGVKSLSMKEIKSRKKHLTEEKTMVDLVKENLVASATFVASKQFNSPFPKGNVMQKLAQFQSKSEARVVIPAKSVKARAAAFSSRSEHVNAKFKEMTPVPRRKYAVKSIVSKIDKDQVLESPLFDAKCAAPVAMTPSRKAAVSARKVTTKRTGSGRLLRSFQDEILVEESAVEVKEVDHTQQSSDESNFIPSQIIAPTTEAEKTVSVTPETLSKSLDVDSANIHTTPEKENIAKLSVRRSGRNTPKIETPVNLPNLKPAYAANTSSPLRKIIFNRAEESSSVEKPGKLKRRRDEVDLEFSVDTENAPKRACVNSDGTVGKPVFKAPPLQTWLDRSMSNLSRTLFGLQ